jgi:hypothetical protein
VKIATYWWGAELYPESDEEWHQMVALFQSPVDLGGYDRCRGDRPATIDDGTGPEFETVTRASGKVDEVDMRPTAVRSGRTTERRCITIDR